MSKDWSRHTRYSDRKAPRGRRGLRVYGERADFNRFFRCPYCNFLIDANEASSPGGPGVPPFLVSTVPVPYADQPTVILGVDGFLTKGSSDGFLSEPGSDGFLTEQPTPTMTTLYFSEVTGGCPFCGASNWK